MEYHEHLARAMDDPNYIKARPKSKYNTLEERCRIEWAVEARRRMEVLQPEEIELEDRWRALADRMKVQSFIVRDSLYPKTFVKAYKHWKERQSFIESELATLFTETKRYVVMKYKRGGQGHGTHTTRNRHGAVRRGTNRPR